MRIILYRLLCLKPTRQELGINYYEYNADEIQAAYDRTVYRTFPMHREREQAIERARTILLDGNRRAQYDQFLYNVNRDDDSPLVRHYLSSTCRLEKWLKPQREYYPADRERCLFFINFSHEIAMHGECDFDFTGFVKRFCERKIQGAAITFPPHNTGRYTLIMDPILEKDVKFPPNFGLYKLLTDPSLEVYHRFPPNDSRIYALARDPLVDGQFITEFTKKFHGYLVKRAIAHRLERFNERVDEAYQQFVDVMQIADYVNLGQRQVFAERVQEIADNDDFFILNVDVNQIVSQPEYLFGAALLREKLIDVIQRQVACNGRDMMEHYADNPAFVNTILNVTPDLLNENYNMLRSYIHFQGGDFDVPGLAQAANRNYFPLLDQEIYTQAQLTQALQRNWQANGNHNNIHPAKYLLTNLQRGVLPPGNGYGIIPWDLANPNLPQPYANATRINQLKLAKRLLNSPYFPWLENNLINPLTGNQFDPSAARAIDILKGDILDIMLTHLQRADNSLDMEALHLAISERVETFSNSPTVQAFSSYSDYIYPVIGFFLALPFALTPLLLDSYYGAFFRSSNQNEAIALARELQGHQAPENLELVAPPPQNPG